MITRKYWVVFFVCLFSTHLKAKQKLNVSPIHQRQRCLWKRWDCSLQEPGLWTNLQFHLHILGAEREETLHRRASPLVRREPNFYIYIYFLEITKTAATKLTIAERGNRNRLVLVCSVFHCTFSQNTTLVQPLSVLAGILLELCLHFLLICGNGYKLHE